MQPTVRWTGLSIAAWALASGVASAEPPPGSEPPGAEAPPYLPAGDALDPPTAGGPDAPATAAPATPQRPEESPPPARLARAAAPAYPQALAARPLLLPSTGIEGGVSLIVDRLTLSSGEADDTWSTFTLEPRARFGFDGFELEAALGIYLFQDEADSIVFTDPERLQSMALALRQRRSADQTFALELSTFNLASDFATVRPTVGYQRKDHLGPAAAVVSGVAVGLERSARGEGVEAGLSFLLEGRLRVEAQVTSSIAAEAHTLLRYRNERDGQDTFFGTTLGSRYGVGVVAAVSPTFDVFASADVLSGTEVGEKLFIVGASSRRVP